jgi:hypothetical protein
MPLCEHCLSRVIPIGHRRYCDLCSRRASALWKVKHRREWARRWRESERCGSPPWLDGWPDLETRRAYYRAYLRRWRQKRRDGN